jgi:hypothetical protein
MIPVPAIPEALKNKTFGSSDIKWVKNVNDKVTYSAYIPPDNPYNRVVTPPHGELLCLQLNPKFEDSLNRVPTGDLILLYQRLQLGKVKCFTHLVTPVGRAVKFKPEKNGPQTARENESIPMRSSRPSGWSGHSSGTNAGRFSPP